MIISVFTDGGSRGNPGQAATGILAYQGTKLLFKQGKKIGVATNNTAEYMAVIHALQTILKRITELERVEKIVFNCDSELVVHQLNGKYKVKKTHIAEYISQIRELEVKISLPIFYQAIPREQNKEADMLVNMALDSTD